jgi:hypothetical protein
MRVAPLAGMVPQPTGGREVGTERFLRWNGKGTTMKGISCLVGAAIAATAALNDVRTAAAGPLPVNATALRAAAADDIVDVRYRGGGPLR